MRGVHIFEKPCYREICVMRGRAMRGLPVLYNMGFDICHLGQKRHKVPTSILVYQIRIILDVYVYILFVSLLRSTRAFLNPISCKEGHATMG